MTDIVERLRNYDKCTVGPQEAADTIEALRAENALLQVKLTAIINDHNDRILEKARLTKERDNALHRAAEYRDKCNSLSNENMALRAARAAVGETE